MVTAPSCSRVSGLILMADIVWLLVSRYNRYPWRHNTNIAADLQLARTTPNVRLTAHLHILSIIMKMTLHLKKCSNSWVLHKTKHWLQITKIIEVTWRSTLSLTPFPNHVTEMYVRTILMKAPLPTWAKPSHDLFSFRFLIRDVELYTWPCEALKRMIRQPKTLTTLAFNVGRTHTKIVLFNTYQSHQPL